MVPVRIVTTKIRFLDTDGMVVQLASPSIHHRDETVSGLGDPMVLGSAGLRLGAWRATVRAGLTVPLGRTEDDPFAAGDLGLPHQHIQLGTGTVNPVLGVEAARSWGRWRTGAFALTQQVVYENTKGYQAGDRYAVGAVVQRELGRAWSLRATVDALAERAERWQGAVPTDDGNQGRFDLIFGAGASVALTKTFGLELALKLPAITRAVGGQLSMPAILEVGASWSIGGPPPPRPHDHAHDHGDDHGDDHDDHDDHGDDHDERAHDAAGVDVADLGQPGEAVALVPVPGKLTIFDFWATWCEPCKKLEPALLELARAHPDRIAIRRIDIVDWDSAAVAKYLTPKAFNLPHLKIFDASGVLVLEQSSEAAQLPALIDAVRVLVERAAAQPR